MYVCMTLLDYIVDVYNVIGLRVSDKSQPLLSGKRGLYNIHSIKHPEMIELESRVIPSNQPQPQLEQVHNMPSVEGIYQLNCLNRVNLHIVYSGSREMDQDPL